MKFASQKFLLLAASAALVLSGCSKKPRPDPSQTLLGQIGGPGSGNSNMPPIDVNTTLDPNLGPRPEGFDEKNLNRSLLQAQAVLFDYDQSAIKASERDKLRVAKEYLDKHPGHRLLLEGRCDWRGTEDYNLGLGDRRANSVKRYLVTLGVPADRIETVSKGSLEAAKNADDATMAKDRRVDLVVSAGPAGAPGAAGAVAPAFE